MYRTPQPYRCPKCGFECKYSEDDSDVRRWPAPEFNDGPGCPKCFTEFIRANIGVMVYAGPPLRQPKTDS